MGAEKRYFFLAITWLFLAFITSKYFIEWPIGLVALSVFVFAVPVALSGGYSSSVNQIRELSYYKEGGRAHRFLSKRWLRSLVWVIAALVTTFLMLLQFASYKEGQWVALAISIPLYWLCHTKIYRFLASELKKTFMITSLTITCARWLCPLLMLCVYGYLAWIFGETTLTYDSLSAALEAERAGLPDHAGTQIVQIALRITTFTDGFKSYATGQSSTFGEYLPLLITVMGTYVVFFNTCTTLSCFSIPSCEMRRVIGPLSDEEVLPPAPRMRIFITSTVVTFAAIFIYFPIFAETESWVKRRPAILESIGALEKQGLKIGDAIYPLEVRDKIEVARERALGKLNVSWATLEGQIDRSFDRMEQKVDGYLDWYYSMPAEYTRLVKIATGEIEVYMAQKFAEHLQEDVKKLTDGLSAYESTYKAFKDEHRNSVNEILEAHPPLDEKMRNTVVVGTMSEEQLYSLHEPSVGMPARASGAAVGATVGAVVTAKVVGKGIFKVAAKAVAKVAASKAVGAGTGAAVGGVIGSVIPVAGTVVGGIVGGIIGGLFTDAALLKLEESFSREAHKQEIVSEIRTARTEFKAKLYPHP